MRWRRPGTWLAHGAWALLLAAVAAAWARRWHAGSAREDATGSSDNLDAVSDTPSASPRSAAATTTFTGVSVWLMVPALQPVIDRAAAQWGLSGHPAHVTLVYGVPVDGELEVERARLAFLALSHTLAANLMAAGATAAAAAPATSTTQVLLKPTHTSSGRSALFGHGYIDLFFQRSPPLDELFEQAMAALGWSQGREAFAGAPHACLGYADPRLADMLAEDGERRLLSWFPGMLEEEYPVTAVALWSTQGTTSDWVELDRIPLQALTDTQGGEKAHSKQRVYFATRASRAVNKRLVLGHTMRGLRSHEEADSLCVPKHDQNTPTGLDLRAGMLRQG
eukprot:jgi/Tetstr1/430046/TSEL_019907.t1